MVLYTYVGAEMAKQKFTTTIDSELLEEIKIQAIREKRSVSDMLEEMIRRYLEDIKTEK